MGPRQIVYTLLLISEIILFSSLLVLSIIGCVKNPNKYEVIWFCSKILTIKNMTFDNTNTIYPIETIVSENELTFTDYNYDFLLQHSTKSDSCEQNFKKCGILDSLGNTMCIPNTDNCPINKIDLNPNYGYQTCTYSNYLLYYTNSDINENIITNIIISTEQPKYITKDNFIFDSETYLELYPLINDDNWGDDDDDDDDDYRRNLDDELYGNNEITDYINKKMEEGNNIDEYYRKIGNELYYRNYIGFYTYEQMLQFMEFDFRTMYKLMFPNTAAIVFGYIGIVPFLIFLCIAINIITEVTPNQNIDCEKCTKAAIIILYMFFFRILFLFFIHTFRYK